MASSWQSACGSSKDERVRFDRGWRRQHESERGRAAQMARYETFHNPRCGRPRQPPARLPDAGIAPTIVESLTDPPTAKRLQEILQMLGFDDPRALMRTKEPIYVEL